MSRYPSVTVIILNYNGFKLSAKCIYSVLKSTYPNFNIVMVDNGSTDNSYYYLLDKFNKNKKVKIVRSEKNLFFTGGCNLGAKNANGAWLVFLNNDCTVKKDWLDYLIKCTKNNIKSLVQPKILFEDLKKTVDNAGGKYSFFGFGQGIGRGEISKKYSHTYQIDFVNGTAFLINRKFFLNLNGFDERFEFFYEDVDLSLRAKKKGGLCLLSGQSIIYHQPGSTMKTSVGELEQQFHAARNRLWVIQKNDKGLILYFRFFTNWPFYLISQLKIGLRFYVKVFKELFPNTPAMTYIFKIKNSLADCQSILDLGCGSGSPIRFLTDKDTTGVDIDRNSLDEARKKSTHKKFILGDIKNICNIVHIRFDAVTAFDVIEHLKPKDGIRLIKDMEKLANKKIVIFTPNGFLHQEIQGKIHQKHESGWTYQDMKKLGFNVYGMFGPKFLRTDGYGQKYKPWFLFALLSEILQYVYTRFYPKTAAAIFCVKTIAPRKISAR